MDVQANSRDKLIGDLRNLVADAEELLKATASQAGEMVAEARQRIEQSLTEGRRALVDVSLIQKSKEAAELADDYARDKPWNAIGIAFGVGLMLGLLLRSSR
jgi:ElaB/YqjD/DUF883 family membrane-anchored ribosome-binding protein